MIDESLIKAFRSKIASNFSSVQLKLVSGVFSNWCFQLGRLLSGTSDKSILLDETDIELASFENPFQIFDFSQVRTPNQSWPNFMTKPILALFPFEPQLNFEPQAWVWTPKNIFPILWPEISGVVDFM